MKPEQFIREFGVEKAREVVQGTPKIGSYWQEYGVDNGTYYGYDSFCGEWYEYWDIPNAPMWQKVFTKEFFSFNRVEVKDLKRLVESLDIITKVGGIHDAIEEHTKWMHAPELHEYRIGETVDRLEQAIRDHESIYGGGDE